MPKLDILVPQGYKTLMEMFSSNREETYLRFILVVGCMFQFKVALKLKKPNQISVCKDRKRSVVCHNQMECVN